MNERSYYLPNSKTIVANEVTSEAMFDKKSVMSKGSLSSDL